MQELVVNGNNVGFDTAQSAHAVALGLGLLIKQAGSSLKRIEIWEIGNQCRYEDEWKPKWSQLFESVLNLPLIEDLFLVSFTASEEEVVEFFVSCRRTLIKVHLGGFYLLGGGSWTNAIRRLRDSRFPLLEVILPLWLRGGCRR